MTAERFSDTIAAVSTPPGRGAIGVVRLSGPDALPIAAACLELPSPPEALEPARQYRAWVVAGGVRIDEAIVSVRRAPRSYTGEDTAEIHCHGGRAVVARVLSALCDAGARPAGPGEFTLRAFVHGKIDLARAEAVAQIVAADSEAQRACAARQLAGGLSREVDAVYRALLDLVAWIEAAIEFPDDGVDDLPPAQSIAVIDGAALACAKLAATHREGRLAAEGARVVIAGRVNAGKSSLLNAFAGEERAIVTAHPGTTRDPVEAIMDWDGLVVRLIDTAGLREPTDEIEAIGQERARQQVDGADAVICAVDGAVPLDPGDLALLASVADRAVVAINKSDLPPVLTVAVFAAKFPDVAAVHCSALTGAGVPSLRAAILARLDAGRACAGDGLLVSSARHYALLREAEGALTVARRAIDAGATADLWAGDLHAAMDALGRITGRAVTADVLDEIFSKFCIGK